MAVKITQAQLDLVFTLIRGVANLAKAFEIPDEDVRSALATAQAEAARRDPAALPDP